MSLRRFLKYSVSISSSIFSAVNVSNATDSREYFSFSKTSLFSIDLTTLPQNICLCKYLSLVIH